MPLTHVCIWDPEIGYRRVTLEEACKRHPYGTSASSATFACELCAQNVGLSRARIDTGTRYFFHSSAEQNKECEDRQIQLSKAGGQSLVSLNSHTMPLKLAVSETSFSFNLGFFYPPDKNAHCDKIRITGEFQHVYDYNFNRIERSGTTYLNVGAIPSRVYKIEYTNANSELKKYWANRVSGISSKGAIFDKRTGKILQSGGKAYAGSTYYLLCRTPVYSFNNDISVKVIRRNHVSNSITWYLHEVRVKSFSAISAQFFLRYSIFLTEKPTPVYPIWPPYIKDSYFIYHNSNVFYFYLNGKDAVLKSYPATANVLSTKDGKLYQLLTKEREQLVSMGKSGALGFSYLIKQPLSMVASLPSITICDPAGTVLTEDSYTSVPKLRYVTVSCLYDGKAIVKRKGNVVHIYKLSGNQQLTIDGLAYDTEIQFFQGSDSVRSLRFEQETNECDVLIRDAELARRLAACSGPMIPVSHAVGCLAEKYVAYPNTRQWLRGVLRRGEMPRKALKMLQDNVPHNNREE